MENITPEYAPGQVMAYHPRNYGWVIGELVRRIDGRTFDRFLREEITGPLGMTDTYVGLPEEHEERVATLYAMEDCDRPGMIPPYNRPKVHQAVQPAGGGIATARDLARFYAMMGGGGTLDGKSILAPQTLTEVTRLQVEGLDHSLGQHMRPRFGLGAGRPPNGSLRGPGSPHLRARWGGHVHRLGRPGIGPGNGLHHQWFPGQQDQQSPPGVHLPGGPAGLPVTIHPRRIRN